jgi:hypothetical protein
MSIRTEAIHTGEHILTEAGVISARLTAVSGDLLDWIAGIQQADKDAGIAALAANDIIVR